MGSLQARAWEPDCPLLASEQTFQLLCVSVASPVKWETERRIRRRVWGRTESNKPGKVLPLVSGKY